MLPRLTFATVKGALARCPNLQCTSCLTLEALLYADTSGFPREHANDTLIVKSLGGTRSTGKRWVLRIPPYNFTEFGVGFSPLRALELSRGSLQDTLVGEGRCAPYSLKAYAAQAKRTLRRPPWLSSVRKHSKHAFLFIA